MATISSTPRASECGRSWDVNSDWISGAPPAEPGRYLVTVEHFETSERRTATAIYGRGGWFNTQYWFIVAWKPLPEPLQK